MKTNLTGDEENFFQLRSEEKERLRMKAIKTAMEDPEKYAQSRKANKKPLKVIFTAFS